MTGESDKLLNIFSSREIMPADASQPGAKVTGVIRLSCRFGRNASDDLGRLCQDVSIREFGWKNLRTVNAYELVVDAFVELLNRHIVGWRRIGGTLVTLPHMRFEGLVRAPDGGTRWTWIPQKYLKSLYLWIIRVLEFGQLGVLYAAEIQDAKQLLLVCFFELGSDMSR